MTQNVMIITDPKHEHHREFGIDRERRMFIVRDAQGEAAWTDLRPLTDEEVTRITEPRLTNTSIGYVHENPGRTL